MSVGRNDPCPCGSGLKYKKCHRPLDEAARPVAPEEGRSTLHDLDNRFVARVAEWALDRFKEDFDLDELDHAFPEIAAGGAEFFIPWSVYHYPVRGLPPFEWYARENASMLSRRERDWIEAQRGAWMSVWEVRECVPGKSMVLADLLTGEQRLVQEASASRGLVVRDAMLTRVVDLGADSILIGTHTWPLPPVEAADVVDVVRRDLRRKLPLPVELLREAGAIFVLAGRWHQAVFERNERLLDPPKLRNTSGDPIRLVTDRYRFIDSTRGAVEAALASIKDASDVEREADGTSVVAFQKGDTVTGTAFVSGEELRLETNSRRRAAALRRKVENACRELLTDHQRSEVDPWDALDEVDDLETNERVRSADEAALIREEKARHYATWPDTPLPFLGNKTPRQAARSRRGREELAVLLKQMENREARQEAETRFDVGILRRELGIGE
jgi:hypothetical protein